MTEISVNPTSKKIDYYFPPLDAVSAGELQRPERQFHLDVAKLKTNEVATFTGVGNIILEGLPLDSDPNTYYTQTFVTTKGRKVVGVPLLKMQHVSPEGPNDDQMTYLVDVRMTPVDAEGRRIFWYDTDGTPLPHYFDLYMPGEKDMTPDFVAINVHRDHTEGYADAFPRALSKARGWDPLPTFGSGQLYLNQEGRFVFHQQPRGRVTISRPPVEQSHEDYWHMGDPGREVSVSNVDWE